MVFGCFLEEQEGSAHKFTITRSRVSIASDIATTIDTDSTQNLMVCHLNPLNLTSTLAGKLWEDRQYRRISIQQSI